MALEHIKNNHRELEPCPAGLFDKIILAIKKEQELRQTRRLLFAFFSLLLVSVVCLPFSWSFFMAEWRTSGIFYFISSAAEHSAFFFAHWEEFTISIFEVVPVTAMIVLAVNAAVALFAIKLFFHRDGLLLKYVRSTIMVY